MRPLHCCGMGQWLVKRRLAAASKRLSAARRELLVADEQLQYIADEAETSELRAMVSESPSAAGEYRDDRRHADSHARNRAKLVEEIEHLERRQDSLLDQLNAATRRNA
jgi:hypothetical protein